MLKAYWFPVKNFGDALNPYLLTRVFNQQVQWTSQKQADICCVGSVLQKFVRGKLYPSFLKYSPYPLMVWSSGFIAPVLGHKKFTRPMHILALRGHQSKALVESIMGRSISCALGDGGLLASYLLEKRPRKKYAMGLVAHIMDRGNPFFAKIADENKNVCLIDFTAPDPMQILSQIAECECIVSSALHGLVTADSLGIPNKWIQLSDKVEGGAFKFQDYYSAYGWENVSPLQIGQNGSLKQLQKSCETYAITKAQVCAIQENLLRVFPF